MRPLSTRTIATALVLLASPFLAAEVNAAGAHGGSARHAAALEAPDPDCPDHVTRQRSDRMRSGPLAWLFRDRSEDVDRPARTFAFYLRSPLLSGLFGCPPQASGLRPPEPVDACAELTITTETLEARTVQVLLPQLDARNAKRLRGTIEERLESGQVVTLIMTGGEPISISPEVAHAVEARACRGGVWN